jgi:hypothetical protein
MVRNLKTGELYWTLDRARQSEWTLFEFKKYVTYGGIEYIDAETIASTDMNPEDLTGILLSRKDVYSFRSGDILSQVADRTHQLIKTAFSWNAP